MWELNDVVENKLICGVGINDVDYTVCPTVDGKRICCKFYKTWKGMLERCYSEKRHAKNPTYAGCSVCSEWLIFSCFKAWMETQDWEGKQLDKDILFVGNKIYSPDTCVFVDTVVNNFVTDRGAARGEWPIGVDFNKHTGKFRVLCSNPFTKKREYLGYFINPEQAHEVWKKRKYELAYQLAELQSDERVAIALVSRYKTDKPNMGENHAR